MSVLLVSSVLFLGKLWFTRVYLGARTVLVSTTCAEIFCTLEGWTKA